MPEELHKKLEEEYKDLPKKEREQAVYGTLEKVKKERKKLLHKPRGSYITQPGVIGKSPTKIASNIPSSIGPVNPRTPGGKQPNRDITKLFKKK